MEWDPTYESYHRICISIINFVVVSSQENNQHLADVGHVFYKSCCSLAGSN